MLLVRSLTKINVEGRETPIYTSRSLSCFLWLVKCWNAKRRMSRGSTIVYQQQNLFGSRSSIQPTMWCNSTWPNAIIKWLKNISIYRTCCFKTLNSRKLSCLIDGVDPFASERSKIKETQTRTIEVDGRCEKIDWWLENNFPVYEEYYPGEGSCVWNYEVNGLQISCRNMELV